PGAYTITGTADGTNVTVKLSANGDVEGGTGVTATPGGGTMTFKLNAGDVVELLAAHKGFWGDANADLSGSLVIADKPVQVISAAPTAAIPSPAVANTGYADHMEETVLPAEVLGDHYIVAPPTTPQGKTVGHYVRFYGNRDGTTLSYPSGSPPGVPTSLAA